jgi:hypothetical protein
VSEPRVVVRRVAAGRYRLDLSPVERQVIGALAGELAAAMADGVDTADPAYARLYPALLPDDPEADAELAAIVRPDLEEGRRRQLETVVETLEAETLAEEQLAAWLGVCNDLRLVIAARMGAVDGNDVIPELDDPDDPDAWPLVVFHFLGWLVGEMVDVLSSGLPDDPVEAAAPD